MMQFALFYLATSYVAWYLEQYEHLAVYPFDDTYATPSEAGVPHVEETVFHTADGAALIVWRAKARPGQPTVLYFPGNSGTLLDRADRFRRLTERGYGLIAPAYRGSSGSGGSPEEALLLADARAIADTATGPVVFYGESLGAAVAIKLAAEGLGQALVLEAPFTSLPELVSVQYPAEDLDHLITQRWNNLDAAPRVRHPLLLLHGTDDKVVPIAMGEMIFAATKSKRKTFLRVDERGHRGLWTIKVQSEIFDFIERLPN